MQLQAVLDALFPPQCGGCEAPGAGVCTQCLPYGPPLLFRLRTLRVCALAPYDGDVRRAVLALKSGRRDVAHGFAHRLAGLVQSGEVLVPVPTTAARRRERGFDGCDLMARILSRLAGQTVQSQLVQIAGDRQRGRGRDARLSACGRFAWRGTALDGRHMVLLDDVVTTGATLEDCAGVLRSAGAVVEKAIAIARA